MNEAETRAEHIDPALAAAGWGVVEGSRIRREYPITPGRIEGHGRRAASRSPPITCWSTATPSWPWSRPRRGTKPLTEGVGQAKDYAGKLAVRFTYATNGQGIYGIDMETGAGGRGRRSIPRPTSSGTLTFAEANAWRDRFAAVPFEDKGGSLSRAATTRTSPSSACWRRSPTDKQRILLTLATGTGKTFIAFQIAWKLFHSRWNLTAGRRRPTRRPRILFLADRNILADQAYNAFSAFPEDALVRIAPDEIRKKGKVPKNGSLFFTIFQTFMSGPPKDGQPSPYFGEYPPDFFDFIVIDECHRGGANDESNWRGILEYFAPAVQLGLTATPKRSDNVDTYALLRRAGLRLLAQGGHQRRLPHALPVKQISTTLDEYVYTPDDMVVEGEVEDGQALRRGRLQPHHRDQGARGQARRDLHGRDRPAREDARLLRHAGPRPRGARPHQPDEDEQRPRTTASA